jgi:hypothetical protein
LHVDLLTMDPLDPLDAQQVVIEYARQLERDVTENRHPARVDTLPHAKPIIQTAIRTSVTTLAERGQLTDGLREYLETAYTFLAEHLDGELVDLMTEYRKSAEDLASQALSARDRTQTNAWRTLSASSSLAGEVARAVSEDADRLRREFRGFLAAS